MKQFSPLIVIALAISLIQPIIIRKGTLAHHTHLKVLKSLIAKKQYMQCLVLKNSDVPADEACGGDPELSPEEERYSILIGRIVRDVVYEKKVCVHISKVIVYRSCERLVARDFVHFFHIKLTRNRKKGVIKKVITSFMHYLQYLEEKRTVLATRAIQPPAAQEQVKPSIGQMLEDKLKEVVDNRNSTQPLNITINIYAGAQNSNAEAQPILSVNGHSPELDATPVRLDIQAAAQNRLVNNQARRKRLANGSVHIPTGSNTVFMRMKPVSDRNKVIFDNSMEQAQAPNIKPHTVQKGNGPTLLFTKQKMPVVTKRVRRVDPTFHIRMKRIAPGQIKVAIQDKNEDAVVKPATTNRPSDQPEASEKSSDQPAPVLKTEASLEINASSPVKKTMTVSPKKIIVEKAQPEISNAVSGNKPQENKTDSKQISYNKSNLKVQSIKHRVHGHSNSAKTHFKDKSPEVSDELKNTQVIGRSDVDNDKDDVEPTEEMIEPDTETQPLLEKLEEKDEEKAAADKEDDDDDEKDKFVAENVSLDEQEKIEHKKEIEEALAKKEKIDQQKKENVSAKEETQLKVEEVSTNVETKPKDEEVSAGEETNPKEEQSLVVENIDSANTDSKQDKSESVAEVKTEDKAVEKQVQETKDQKLPSSQDKSKDEAPTKPAEDTLKEEVSSTKDVGTQTQPTDIKTNEENGKSSTTNSTQPAEGDKKIAAAQNDDKKTENIDESKTTVEIDLKKKNNGNGIRIASIMTFFAIVLIQLL